MEDRDQMIIEPKRTAVAYRCPDCGTGVMSAVDVFNLAADRVRLKCSDPECPTVKNKSADGPNGHLDIVAVKDAEGGKVRLCVPCIFCGKPHTFTVNTSLFFGKDLFLLSCPYSGINICFIGDLDHVKAELARSELELLDMLEEHGISDIRDFDADEAALPDPQVYEIVMFVIRDLEAEGKIFCRCKARGEEEQEADAFAFDGEQDSDYSAEITENGVLVRCRKCGAEKLIATDSLIRAHDFLNCDSLTLE